MKFFLFIFAFSIFTQAKAADIELISKAVVQGAPKLHLILNEDYLITYALVIGNTGGKFRDDVLNFQNTAWEIDQATYQKLQKSRDPKIKSREGDSEFLKEFSHFFNTLKKTPEYKLVLEETLEYMHQSLIEWDANLAKSTPFIQKYSGFNFDYKVSAYITHPALRNGQMQSSEQKILTFGAWPTFDNYFTVYIWHEIIHFHMPLNKFSHVANQLLTDNQLRVYLNGGSLEPLEGHSGLMSLMNNNLSRWEQYMKNPTDLNQFAKEIAL